MIQQAPEKVNSFPHKIGNFSPTIEEPPAIPDRKPPFVLPLVIPRDERRRMLVRYAASLSARRRTHDQDLLEEEIKAELHRVNLERCRPRLTSLRDLKSIDRIAAWAAKKSPASKRNDDVTRTVDAALRLTIDNARRSLSAFAPNGTFDITCKLVAHAVFKHMLLTGKGHIEDNCEADCRTIAKLSGYGFKTVARALRRLSGEKVADRKVSASLILFHRRKRLKPFQRPDGSWVAPGNRFQLLPRFFPKQTHSISLGQWESVCVQNGKISETVHDAFRGRDGMAKSRMLVLGVVEQFQCKSAKEVAGHCGGLTVKTTSNALTELRQAGLIEKKGVYRVTGKSLDKVAEERGSLGASQTQCDDYEYDRKNYLDILPDLLQSRKLRTVPKEPEYNEAPQPTWDDLGSEVFYESAA